MQQAEVIQQALREAPPSPAGRSHHSALEPGEKLIRAGDLGDVDLGIVEDWVLAHGGRAADLDDSGGSSAQRHWVIRESELAL